MNSTQNTRVAIIISTMNRPDFLIRTLNYYAKLKSPHPVYLGDSGNPENAEKITSTVDKLRDRLEIHYNWYPPGLEPTGKILAIVKEKYAILNGDDDYEIPSTLTKGAEFLENNPDYTAAGGNAVSFRLKTSGPYGESARLADYPNHSLEAETASQRLIDFLKICFPITFTSINRVEHLKKIWVIPIPVGNTWGELLQICHCAVSGKVKLIDGLGVVRQIHDKQWRQRSMVDWLIAEEFHDFYTIFQDHLSRRVMEIDNINQEQANKAVKDAFWEYLQVYMAREKRGLGGESGPAANLPTLKSLRTKIGVSLPILKTIYREYIRPIISDKKQMHYEVLNPRSSYYKDFQHVMDSFTGKDLKS